MKKQHKTLNMLLAATMLLGAAACKKMDDYLRFTDGREIPYTGKVDSLKLHPGNNRILLSGLLIADPKITGLTIYWNSGADSVVVPVKRTEGVDTIRQLFNQLAEGTYNFELRTWNNEGHRSVPAFITGKAYGAVYIGSLLNRGINETVLQDNGNALIKWGDPEETAIGMEVKYLQNGRSDSTRLVLGRSETETLLANYKRGSQFSYRTLFKPDTLAIDTFYAPLVARGVRTNVTDQYLKNYRRPFAYSAWDGSRWGTLKDWIINDAAKNRDGGYGGYDNISGGAGFCFEKWTGEKAIVNGKAYQTITLPAGNYEFSFSSEGYAEAYHIGSDPRYLVAAAGSTLPDVAQVNESLSYTSFVDQDNAAIRFSLTATTTVSLGMVMNFEAYEAQGFRINDVKLFRLP